MVAIAEKDPLMAKRRPVLLSASKAGSSPSFGPDEVAGEEDMLESSEVQ